MIVKKVASQSYFTNVKSVVGSISAFTAMLQHTHIHTHTAYTYRANMCALTLMGGRDHFKFKGEFI